MALEAQDNPFPYIKLVDTADPSSPAAGSKYIWVDTDDLLKMKDESGTVTAFSTSDAIANPLSTDTLWDAAGDLVVGSGANTAAKLSIGATNGMHVERVSGAVAWALPPGYQFDYAEITTSTTHTQTSAAAATAAITGAAVAYDGSTRVKIEFWTAALEAPNILNASVVIELYDGSTDLGRIAQHTAPAAQQSRTTVYGVRFLTPTAATHTYSIRGWVTSGTGTISATSTYLPAFMRITKA